MHLHQPKAGCIVLRITHTEKNDKTIVDTVQATPTGPWVVELRNCFECHRHVAEKVRTVVDLSEVTFIDESGELLLAEMRDAGVKFVAAGVETKFLLANLRVTDGRSLRRRNAPPIPPLRRAGSKQGGESEMTNHRGTLRVWMAALFFTAAVAGTVGCTSKITSANSPSIPEVDVAKVEMRDIPIEREWIGTLDGFVNADIKARGRRLSAEAELHGRARSSPKGQLLFQIDARPLVAAEDQAEAQLAQAKAQLLQANAGLLQARAQLSSSEGKSAQGAARRGALCTLGAPAGHHATGFGQRPAGESSPRSRK